LSLEQRLQRVPRHVHPLRKVPVMALPTNVVQNRLSPLSALNMGDIHGVNPLPDHQMRPSRIYRRRYLPVSPAAQASTGRSNRLTGPERGESGQDRVVRSGNFPREGELGRVSLLRCRPKGCIASNSDRVGSRNPLRSERLSQEVVVFSSRVRFMGKMGGKKRSLTEASSSSLRVLPIWPSKGVNLRP